MNVDIESLGSFSRTANEGAERAAENLTGMTGIETGVDVSKVSLVSADELVNDDAQRIGVAHDFEGGIDGTSFLTLSPEGVETLLDALVPGEGLGDSAVTEVGNVVTCGFIDGWADHFETTIDISPPQYVAGTGAELIDATTFERDQAFVFRSQVSAVGEALDIEFYMFPEPDSMQEMLAESEDEIPVEKLVTLKRMARNGAETASESISTMTGIDTSVDVTQLNFVPVEDVPAEVDRQNHVGVVLEFDGAPSGYVMILFGETSGREVAEALVPDGSNLSDAQMEFGAGEDDEGRSSTGVTWSGHVGDVEPFDEIEQSAIEEIGNVMTSSFIDGWANVFDTAIDISTPQFVHDMGSAIAESVVSHLGRTQAFAFLFDATLRAADQEFDCAIYVLPDEAELRAAVQELDPEATAERTTRAGSL